MCTVTYLPLGNNNFILTSNRDEDPNRKTIPPKTYIENGIELKFPKDKIAGGTWIGLSEKNRLICLLNGGFKKHIRKTPYKMSRGVIVKLLLTADNAIAEIENFDFNGIEPFTIVLVDWETKLNTYELVWTGAEKHFRKLEQKPYIWSSATLYTQEIKSSREKWFTDWLSNQKEFSPENILEFHQDETRGTKETSIKMLRDNVKTISTTCVEKYKKQVSMDYISYI